MIKEWRVLDVVGSFGGDWMGGTDIHTCIGLLEWHYTCIGLLEWY